MGCQPSGLRHIAAISLCFSGVALGQGGTEPAIPSVMVTGSRTEQAVRDAIPHATVITQQQMRDAGDFDLASLIRREAGFELIRNGGTGNSTSLFMRGSESRHTLVLIDGVRAMSPTTGQADLANLLVDQIERVEIVRGNVSSLYGSGAIGGVIQIFTKQGSGPVRPNFAQTIGSRSTRETTAGIGGDVGQGTRFNLGVSHFETANFSSFDPSLNAISQTRVNPDSDGYRNTTLNASVSHAINRDHRVGLRFYQAAGAINFDNPFLGSFARDTHYTHSLAQNLVLDWRGTLAPWWKTTLVYAENKDFSDTFKNDRGDGYVRAGSRQKTWQNDFRIAPGHTLSATLEDQTQEAATNNFTRIRTTRASLLGYVGAHEKHQWQINSRRDVTSDFGNANTWLGGYGFQLTESFKLTAMLSTAFNAPTFNQLYFPRFGSFVTRGETLRPERVRSKEWGVQYEDGPHLARLVVFRSDYLDLVGSNAAFQAINVSSARIHGVEMSYSGVLAGWDTRVGLTIQNPINTGVAPFAQLTRRAKQFGSLSLGRGFGAWRVSGHIQTSSSRPDTTIAGIPFAAARPINLPGYAITNFTARYDFGGGVSLAAKLENAFDKRYNLVYGYNTPGRGVFLTLAYQPK